jgi:hypothetical protein
MSIIEEDSDSVIRLGTVHSWLFKISMWAAPIFFIWAVTAIMRHDTEIAVMKMQIAWMQSSNGGGKGSVSQNVNVGKAETEAELAASARDYVTTADIAKQEKVSERAVIDWIAAGRIEPMPVKSGKSWAIARNFRILPNDTECCGETPNNEPENRP